MKRDEPGNLDLLAAEYALGTLRGLARRAFARRMKRDPFVDRRVVAWEERFALLALRLKPVAPSPAVWTALEGRIGTPVRRSWRGLAAAAALVAVIGLGWYVWQGLRPPAAPQAYAVFADASRTDLWRVALDAKGERLAVDALVPVSVPDARSRELWALPDGGSPVSLGLMPATGSIEIALDEDQRAALAAAKNVAVSDEPAGGSPTGAPTGDILFIAAIVRT
jgi:anti-sigma-K factor RskA